VVGRKEAIANPNSRGGALGRMRHFEQTRSGGLSYRLLDERSNKTLFGNWAKERRMATETVKKCGHPNCSCAAPAGKYCSVQCETMEKMPDIECKCGHAGCKGKID
jgi:metallothionein